MICPICGESDIPFEDHIYRCHECYGEFGYLENLIDPAELLELIEKAIEHQRKYSTPADWYNDDRATVRMKTLEAIKSYLSGDSEPLKKLGE